MHSKLMTASFVLGLLGWFGGSKKADPDAEVLRNLKKAGSDLTKPHKIEFFLYFPEPTLAQSVANKLKEQGFETDVRPAAQGPGWLCFAVKNMVPALEGLQKIRSDFDSLTASLGGEYDGWGTAVVR